MSIFEFFFSAIYIWLMIGGGVAAVFLIVGIDRIDEDAQDSYIFRPLLVPGILLIWPLVLWRWYILEMGHDKWTARYAPPRKYHLIISIFLVITVCVIIYMGLSNRQTWPQNTAPVQLSISTGDLK
ncbi:MAG: hypothetical protein V7776_22295 [Halopseudomonas aestusnigri]